jgi:hypothetical protein
MTVDELVEKIGQHVHGQLTYTWDTRQTAEQYAEILSDGGDSTDFTMEQFLEYVRSNTSDIIAQTVEEENRIGIERDIYILDEYGSIVEEL